MDLKEEEQHSPINVHCKYMVSLSFLFRSNEGEDFSAQWRVGNFRAKVNIKSRLERKKIRSKKGAEYSTQVSSPVWDGIPRLHEKLTIKTRNCCRTDLVDLVAPNIETLGKMLYIQYTDLP